jgi:hypothetical protein
MLSLALQYGTPAAAIRAAVTRAADGSPAGIIGRVLDLLEADLNPFDRTRSTEERSR